MVDYIKHLTPVSGDWKNNIAGDLVKIAKDPDVPTKLRDVIRGDLMEIKEDLERFIISTESEEW